jgi:nitrate/TMAO reductase-like tetraheme cytochrome c subunit
MKRAPIFPLLVAVLVAVVATVGCDRQPDAARKAAGKASAAHAAKSDYLRATYSPLHFRPAIANATDGQCLECHQEILSDKVREASPAGVKASLAKAWYQQMATYAGDQETFHRRHLETPLARKLMRLQCNTCHQGHDPREEALIPSSSTDAGFTLRKQVNPETTCLKCHGQMPYENMGLPAPWPESKASLGNNCLVCHAAIRTTRHQVTYLDAAAIEKAAEEQGGDVCYGCHGGRAWYRIAYPYPRHAWPDMPAEVPDWAKSRPTASEPRFQIDVGKAAAAAQPAKP